MEYERIISNNSGRIWLINTNDNTIIRNESETKRAFEQRALLFLLHHEFGKDELMHNVYGAPYLKNHNELEISNSHSYPWICLYASASNAKKLGSGICWGRCWGLAQEELSSKYGGGRGYSY